MGIVVQEGEAVALAGVFVVGKHRVAQAAGFADDGQRAVAQGDHLRKAAGLEHGRHQEHDPRRHRCWWASAWFIWKVAESWPEYFHCAQLNRSTYLLSPMPSTTICAPVFMISAEHALDQIEALLAETRRRDHADDGRGRRLHSGRASRCSARSCRRPSSRRCRRCS